ncbi:MAG: hypothetical protein ACTSXC_03785 [Candidatus Freyarchaeota archaeon]
MEPQAIVAVTVLGMIALVILLSKLLTKIWLYVLLLSPSWGIALYNVFDAASKGESLASILLNHCTGIIFILNPIDEYVVKDPTLRIYGLCLIGIWTYIVAAACLSLLKGKLFPLFPLIVWLLGKGCPNTTSLLSPYLPSWLLTLSGLPLVLLICILIGAVMFLAKRRK